MGIQACSLPALKRLKPLKPLKRLKPLKLCIRVSERPTAQAKATPRPHQWLLLAGPACRSPGVTRFKPFKLAVSEALTAFLAKFLARQTLRAEPRQGQINRFFLASKPAVCQPLQASKGTPRPDQWLLLGVQACRLPPFSFTTPSCTENWFPQTVRWSICPVFTSLATFPLQAGQT